MKRYPVLRLGFSGLIALFLVAHSHGAPIIGVSDSTTQSVPRDTLDASVPTLVAFFIASTEQFETDTSEEFVTVLDDFQTYVSSAFDTLRQHGVTLLTTTDSILVIRGTDGHLSTRNLIGTDSLKVGYWLFRPGAEPKYLPGGVRVDFDLIAQAARYFPGWNRR